MKILKSTNWFKINIVVTYGVTCSEQLAHEHCNIDGNDAIGEGGRTPDLAVNA